MNQKLPSVVVYVMFGTESCACFLSTVIYMVWSKSLQPIICIVNIWPSSCVDTAPFPPFLWQYFKMDPNNYNDYGGVEHVEYCFEVCSDDLHHLIMSLRSFGLVKESWLDFDYLYWWKVA